MQCSEIERVINEVSLLVENRIYETENYFDLIFFEIFDNSTYRDKVHLTCALSYIESQDDQID